MKFNFLTTNNLFKKEFDSIVHELKPDDELLRNLCTPSEYEDIRIKLDYTNSICRGGVYATLGLNGRFENILHVRVNHSLYEKTNLRKLYEDILFTADALDIKTLGIPLLGLDDYSFNESNRILLDVLYSSKYKVEVKVIYDLSGLNVDDHDYYDDSDIFKQSDELMRFVTVQDRPMDNNECKRMTEFIQSVNINNFFTPSREYQYPMDFVYDFIDTNGIDEKILNEHNASLTRQKKEKLSKKKEIPIKDLEIIIFILSKHGLNKDQAIQLFFLNGTLPTFTRPIDRIMVDYLTGKLRINTLEDMDIYVNKITNGKERFSFSHEK